LQVGFIFGSAGGMAAVGLAVGMAAT
jgi:hypothetical protein